jgi:hypothetical protein
VFYKNKGSKPKEEDKWGENIEGRWGKLPGRELGKIQQDGIALGQSTATKVITEKLEDSRRAVSRGKQDNKLFFLFH